MPRHSTRSGQEHPHTSANPALVTWDTSYVTPRDRFSHFREGICQALCAFTPEKPESRDVKARVEHFAVAHGHIGRLQMTPMRLRRDQADIAKIPGDDLVLVRQLGGRLQGQLGGHPFRHEAGDFNLASSNEVLDFEIGEGGVSSLSLWFPRKALENCVEVECTHPLSPASVVALGVFFRLINDRLRHASLEEMTHLFDATLSTMMAGLIKDREFLEDRCGQESAVRKGLFEGIQTFINQEIANPQLSTGQVAAHFGISPRYLQKLFANEGTTFKSTVTNARLDRIRADLLDVALAHVAANDIAFRWGFRETTTFHRNFKSRFDDTPFQMRSSMKSNLSRRLRRPS